MTMQDALQVIEPGKVFTADDIKDSLIAKGYRETNPMAIRDSVHKLYLKGYIQTVVTGYYILLEPGTDASVLEDIKLDLMN